MGVPINVPDWMFGLNMSLVNGASIPKCKISKEDLVICYHAIQEASVAGICIVGSSKVKKHHFRLLDKDSFLVPHNKNKSRNGCGGNRYHGESILHIFSVNFGFL